MTTASSNNDVSFDFRGRVALVTGGTDGIGLGIAQAFAKARAKVVICSRSEERVRSAEQQVREHTEDVLALPVDVRDESSVATLFAATAERFGGLDVLVNNAGGSFSDSFDRGALLSLGSNDILEAFRLNAIGMFNCTKQSVPLMRERGAGSVINITSGAADGTSGAMGAYGAAKAALNNLTRTMAEEFAPEIRVNGVSPGPTITPRTAGDHIDDDDITLMRRLGAPSDIASAVLFLCSSAASWITGTVLHVDGGRRLGPRPKREPAAS